MNELIIVMGGSFNPPTIAHQRLLLGAVKPLLRAEVRDIAFGGHACTAEEHDIFAFVYDFFQSFIHKYTSRTKFHHGNITKIRW